MRTKNLSKSIAVFGVLAVVYPGTARPEKLISETPELKIVEVERGDTLSILARKYLGDPMKWNALMRHNNITNPDVIDPGTRLEIPLALKDSKQADPAEVIFATPHEIYYDFQRQGRHLGDGDFIPPAGLISAGEGTALLRLPDQSKFHMENDSAIELTSFFESKNNEGKSVFQAFMKTVQGRVKFEVSKVTGGGRFEVATPAGIVKVKGTAFAIEIAGGGNVNFETTEGEIAVQLAGSDVEVPIAAGQGAVIPNNAKSLDQVKKIELLRAPAPGNSVQNGAETSFRWEKVPGAVRYIVYGGGDADFSEPTKLGDTRGQETLSVQGLPAGQYYWNVIAVDENGLRSPAADPKPFRIQ